MECSKYKFMETQTTENKARIKAKIPDITASLEAVKMLMRKQSAGEEFTNYFLLSDQVYTKAEITPQNKVGLWLGANIMLEYTYDEAMELLTKNLQAAEAKLAQYIEDLSFLKDQIITCEVDMARVFNWDVKTRRAKGLTGTSSSSASLASGGGNRNVPGLSQSKAEMIAEIRAAAGGGGAGR